MICLGDYGGNISCFDKKKSWFILHLTKCQHFVRYDAGVILVLNVNHRPIYLFFFPEGKEHNFKKYEDDFITDLNTPYDYESIMHYRPLSFNKNETVPTITTTIPYFNDVIGQRLDFSAVDIIRLNRMYDCGKFFFFISFLSLETYVSHWNVGKKLSSMTRSFTVYIFIIF